MKKILLIKMKIWFYLRLIRIFLTERALPDYYRPLCPLIFSVYDRLKLLHIGWSVKLISGPETISYKENEAIVLCLLKDGEVWIQNFIEHYFRKGFKHIVLLDNLSNDNTLNIARCYENITVLQISLPFRHNNILMRRYLVNRFAKGRWSLSVDIDELWDYPLAEKVSLNRLLEYLRTQGANALVAQMLDMFSFSIPYEQKAIKDYNFYDISRIRKAKLMNWGEIKDIGFVSDQILNDQICLFKGGVRDSVFGLNGVWLTKMPLLFHDGKLRPFYHQHFSNNAIVADISSVLFHYKFTHLFRQQVQSAIKIGQYNRRSADYRVYARSLEKDPLLIMAGPDAKRLDSVQQLVDENFLIISDNYLRIAQ